MKLLTSLFFAGVALRLVAGIAVGETELQYIVCPENAPDTVKLAAAELRDFVAASCQVKLKIVPEAVVPQGNIYLGENPELTAKIKPEGFRITASAGNVHISGHDSASEAVVGLRNPWRRSEVYNEELKLGAFGEAGSLYGVYYFLEHFLGVRFYMPGELGTVIPENASVTVPANTDIVREPVFNYRHSWFCDFNESKSNALWYRRVGFGGVAPVQIIDFNEYFTSRFKDTKPELFALIGGQRDFGALCAVRGGGQLCYSNPETIRLVAEEINRYFEENPRQLYFPLVPGDGLIRICECPQCAAQVDKSRDQSGWYSDYVWGFVNRVAKEVAKKHPDRFVGCLAYDTYLEVPKNIDRLEPNVAVMLCKNRGAMAAPGYREEMLRRIDGWRAITDNNLFAWDYYLQNWIPWQELPCVFAGTIQRDLNDLRDRNFGGEFIEAEALWADGETRQMLYPATQHLNLYVTGKLYWDPTLDLDALLDEYCELFYGPGKDAMRRFVALCQERWLLAHQDAGGRGIGEVVSPTDVFDIDTLEKLSQLLEEACAAVPADSVYASRIARMTEEFSHGRATLVVMVRNQPPEMTARFADAPEAINGMLTDPAWRGGEAGFMVDKRGESVKNNALVYARNDGNMLYFGFILGEPKTDKLKMDKNERDAPAMYLDDCVEIYLMPYADRPDTGYQFIVNSAGALWDAKRFPDGSSDIAWNSTARSAARVEDHRWLVEVAIPMSEVDIVPGQTVKANFYRSRVVDEGQRFSCWSPTLTEGHFTPARFGSLKIAGK